MANRSLSSRGALRLWEDPRWAIWLLQQPLPAIQPDPASGGEITGSGAWLIATRPTVYCRGVAVVAPGLAAPSRCRSRVTAAGTADRDGNDSSMNSNRLTSGSMTAEVAGAGSSVLSWPIRAWPDQVASTRPEPPASRTVALSMVAGAILVLVSWYS